MLNRLVQRAVNCFHKNRDVADGASEKNSISEVANMPDERQLEAAFRTFVAELDLSPDKETLLYSLPMEKKWIMLVEQTTRQDKMAIYQSCEYFVGVLNATEKSLIETVPPLKDLEALAVILRTQSHSYVKRFLKLKGLEAILTVLSYCLQSSNFDELAAALLICIKSLLNSTYGRAAVFELLDGLTTIAICFGLVDSKCKILSLEILSGLCIISDGHRKVLSALTNASEVLGERTRFQRMFEELWKPCCHYAAGQSAKENIRLKTSIMSLVTALLKTGHAENSLEFRLHLRYEFLMLGMQETVDRLRIQFRDSAALSDHLDLFDMMRDEDEQELSGLVDSGSSSPIDYENPAAMADVIGHKLADSIALPHFISLLQHLLIVPGDRKFVHLWRLFDIVLQQLSLQVTMGIVADTYEPVINVDMNEILTRLHTQNEYETLERSYHNLRTEMDREKNRVIELENRLADLIDDGGCQNSLKCSLSPCPSFVSTCSSFLPPIKPPSLLPPPPPPPPSSLTNTDANPLKKTLLKSVPRPPYPLKSLNWTLLDPRKITGSIWDSMDYENLYKQTLDLVDLAANFAIKNENESVDWNSTLQKRLKNESRTRVTVIEKRRAQNCTILLSKLRLTNGDLRTVVLTMDEKKSLPKDMVEQLLKYIPTKKEVTLLNEAVSKCKSPAFLAIADRFLLEMSRIHRYEERLKCLHTIITFRDRIDDVRPPILAVSKATNALTSNRHLKQLFALLLAVGNFLNYGKRNGDALGFTISSLNGLNDVKNSLRFDRTLLHYFVEIVDTKFPEILRLKRDLSTVFEAARYSCREMSQEIKLLDQNVESMRAELTHHRVLDRKRSRDSEKPSSQLEMDKESKFVPDRFVPVVEEFLIDAEKQLDELHSIHGKMKKAFHPCAKEYGEDPLTTSPEHFFGIFAKFLGQFSDAHHLLRREKKEDERAKQMTISRSICLNKSKRLASREGDFEQLILALQSGELFSEELSRLRTSFRVPNRKSKTKRQPYARKSIIVDR